MSGICICGKNGNMQCGNCKLQKYCSVECQKDHWKTHKMVCNFVKTELLANMAKLVDEGTPNEHLLTSKGVKEYTDITKHDFLEIPQVESKSQGKIYEVLNAVPKDEHQCMITIKENQIVTVYRLPQDPIYYDWIQHILRKGIFDKINILPCRAEFGYLINEKQYYVEVL